MAARWTSWPEPTESVLHRERGGRSGRSRRRARSPSSPSDRRLRAVGHRNGADGNIWFTENAGNRVGRLTVAPGAGRTRRRSSPVGRHARGTVTPRSQATTYSFDWGLTTGVRVEHGDGRGRQRRPRAVTAPISGLAPSTTYHFRVVATNAAGTTLGADRTFTTLGAPRPRRPRRRRRRRDERHAERRRHPERRATSYHFEVGLTTAYGDRVPAADAVVGVGHAPARPPADAERARARHDLPLPGRRDERRGYAYGSRPVVHDRRAGALRAAGDAARAPPSRLRSPAAGDAPRPRPVGDDRSDLRRVLVQLPGTGAYLPLSAASTVPVGTTIDATHGTLKLTNVRDRAASCRPGLLGRVLHRSARRAGRRPPPCSRWRRP